MILHQTISLALNSALVFTLCAGMTALPQNETRAEVTKAVSLMQEDRALAVSQLRALGNQAIPYVVEILKSGNKPVVQIRLTLLHFVAEKKGSESDAALLTLLSGSEPDVRGFAAASLGERKLEPAIPKLIALLNDREVYMSHVTTDPYREEHTLVRDVVIKALQSITGQNLAKGKSQEKQAKTWERWWQERQQ